MVKGIVGNTYECQYRFLLQTGLRTGEWRVGEPKSKAEYPFYSLDGGSVGHASQAKAEESGSQSDSNGMIRICFPVQKGNNG